ncbi:MAG: YceI family protein [Polyangia bacterium]
MTWTVDSVHSHVGFSVRHMMVTTVRGQFHTYSGEAALDPADFTRSTFAGEIDVVSIDTASTDRDNHLRTGDFFDAARFPKIAFKSTSITKQSDGEYKVKGDLTIRGIAKPIELDVEFAGTNKNPYGKTVAGLSARGSISRKDYGMEFNAVLDAGGLMVGDQVKLELDVELVQS